jgi:hypothetical protein
MMANPEKKTTLETASMEEGGGRRGYLDWRACQDELMDWDEFLSPREGSPLTAGRSGIFCEAAARPTVVPVQLEIGQAKLEVESAQVEKLLLLSDLYNR